MGMYTKFSLNCRIKEDSKNDLINHFELLYNTTMYYFDDKITQKEFDFWISKNYLLLFRENIEATLCRLGQDCIKLLKEKNILIIKDFEIKNYYNSLNAFLSFILPYIEANEKEIIGTFLYEEDLEEHQDMIIKDGSIMQLQSCGDCFVWSGGEGCKHKTWVNLLE